MKQIRYEMRMVSCQQNANLEWNKSDIRWNQYRVNGATWMAPFRRDVQQGRSQSTLRKKLYLCKDRNEKIQQNSFLDMASAGGSNLTKSTFIQMRAKADVLGQNSIWVSKMSFVIVSGISQTTRNNNRQERLRLVLPNSSHSAILLECFDIILFLTFRPQLFMAQNVFGKSKAVLSRDWSLELRCV